MAVQITKAKGVADQIKRTKALQAIENKTSTTQLVKFEELCKMPGALKKFEENFEMLKSFL